MSGATKAGARHKAVKIADGGSGTRSVALLAILDQPGLLSQKEKQNLQSHRSPEIINSRGRVIGEICPAESCLV